MEQKYTLGLNLGKVDSSATLFKGPHVIAHVEQERFSRNKKAHKEYPLDAIKYCLNLCPNGLDDVEAITLGFDHDMFLKEVPDYFNWETKEYPTKPSQSLAYETNRLEQKHPEKVRKVLKEKLESAGLVKNHYPKVIHYTHHLCHALCAHLSSPFQDSLGLVVDANSEIDTLSVWDCRGTQVKKIYSKPLPHSLGWVYRSFTQFCGFDAYSGEGKLMGLAPYGKPNAEIAEKIKKILEFKTDENGEFEFDVDATYIYLSERDPEHPHLTKKFLELFGTPSEKTSDPAQYYKDVAYEIQDAFEKLINQFAKRFLVKTGHRHLTLSGGVHLNCKVNGYIWRECQDLLDDIYIFPMSSDDGIGFGSNLAYAVEHHTQNRDDYKLETAYLGPSFNNQEINAYAQEFSLRNKFLHKKQYEALNASLQLKQTPEETEKQLSNTEGYNAVNQAAQKYLKTHLQQKDDIVSYAARQLAEGKIIAWFQGRMEAGPRALGSRSILADPRSIKNRDRTNAKVKFREIWRPFCPSVLKEHADKYFKYVTQSPFMINTFQVTDHAIEKAPAIVHVDNTARPQFLTKEANPKFHQLISAFYELTGVPILLNTSMNIKGEPICCTPDNGFQFFFATDIDILVIGDFCLEKQNI